MRYFRSIGSAEHKIGKASSHKITILTLATLVCAIAALGVGAYSKRSPEARLDVAAGSAHVASVPVLPASQAGSSKVEAEVITIRPTGFHPERITRPQGQFVLAVENRSGLQMVDLFLEDQARRNVFATRVSVVKPDLARRFDLLPGSYVLREMSHPVWSCTITIEGK